MNTAIDVNATFNTLGEIKPLYIRVEESDHKLEVYRVEIVNVKDEKYNGIHSLLFICNIVVNNDVKREIKIRYYIESHKWAVIN